jgi:predicted AAA+ superfamily ATPase
LYICAKIQVALENLHFLLMSKYIERSISAKIQEVQPYYPVTIITGSRQVGKTTLCKKLFDGYSYVNLEQISDRTLAKTDPVYFLDTLGDKVIIDEVQNCPEILSSIQVRVDNNKSLRYILTGSSNFSLLHNVCQSLAGRAALFTLPPFSLAELSDDYKKSDTDVLMYNGFYPGVLSDEIPAPIFYRNYFNTYIERDVRNLLKVKNLEKFDIFVRLLAGRSGAEFKSTSLAVEVGVSSTTIAEWLSILEAAYIVFPLRPYFNNFTKRLTKMPKVYFYDTGLMAFLLGVEHPAQIQTHPLRGALFENLVVAEMMKRFNNEAKVSSMNFYREHSGREVDMLISTPNGIDAYEIKSARTFRPEFCDNLQYLAKKLGDRITRQCVIYDGETIGDRIQNVRDL